MEHPISASMLNDFIFCPVSIYFHGLYEGKEVTTFQSKSQTRGTAAHEAVDHGNYSTRVNMLTGMKVFSEEYGLICIIDMFDTKMGKLTERKKKIKQIYDGYIYQLYAQYFCLTEMGYIVKKIQLYSMDDNKTYHVELPLIDIERFHEFINLLEEIRTFDMEGFIQTNASKCKSCIYQPLCDRSLEELQC